MPKSDPEFERGFTAGCDSRQSDIDELRARIAELEAALRQIQEKAHLGMTPVATDLPNCAGCVARAVLAPKGGEDGS